MVTTIQVNEPTLKLLKKFKADLNAHSYNEVINKMAKLVINKQSMYGALGKEKSMQNILKDLRDKHDRIS